MEFIYREDVDYVINNRKYLPDGVFIDREYTKATEEQCRILRPFLRAARQLTKYQRKCKLVGGTLVIKGIRYTTNDLHKLPTELQGMKISSKENSETLGFFGIMHPFSNFHPAEFSFAGHKYHCSEQLIQHLKAVHFEDEEVSRKIMSAKNALECKNLSKEIENYKHDTWATIAKAVCEEGIKAKFTQNENLQKTLLDTEDKVIVECSYDQLWGTGIPLHEEGSLSPDRWVSQGILGEILQETRRFLQARRNTTIDAESVNTSMETEAAEGAT